MKKFLSFLIIIIAAIIVWVLYINSHEEDEPAVAVQTTSPERIQPSPTLLQGPPAEVPSSSRKTVSKRSDIYAVARELDVKIISYKEGANQATVLIESRERNALGDFLDLLVEKAIIRDFDYDNRSFKALHDKQLQRYYRCEYVLKW